MTTVFIIIGIIITALVVVLIVLGMRASKLTEELEAAEMKHQSLAAANRELQAQVTTLGAENQKKIGWLDHMEEELNWHKGELEKRPKLERKIYRILTLGMKATGKSSLTLKWSNPLVDLGTIEGTKIERYERTVSHVRNKDTLVEHVFEVHDWGGEHIVDAQQELIIEEIHGLLMVVDLGGKDAQQVDTHRIGEQLNEFNPQALKYFFSPKTVASCKSVVLFINKSDLIPGSPAQAEAQAKALYAPLIDSLRQYATQIDVKVLVGSASYGHSTHVLFSHFVEQILPKSAYDNQLLQRMKSEFRSRASTITPGMNGPTSQSQPGFPPPQIPHAQPPSNGHQQMPTPQHYGQAAQHAPAPQAPVPPSFGPRPGFAPPNKVTMRMPDASNPMEATAPLLNRQPPPMPRKG
ncbi:GTPase domain-containing protein [Polyangium sp. y55x31]|uniref:GTPase domain-containing protein n=1 Tax=Polyangium sp. y55x31 TaxID=3042688 RepID=UPI0024831CA7|nr:GTPase domain-containing protein [Polyangium sp. y55x31]MDI1476400.1 GTPase domain-containing protein [Polyangium sp. y55x31]